MFELLAGRRRIECLKNGIPENGGVRQYDVRKKGAGAEPQAVL
jgi:hypothetical protein